MVKTATEVMQEVIFSTVIDAVTALKSASKGLPNTLLRDLNAIHANTTFADLPTELQTMITGSVRTAFTRLMKEGYSVSGAQAPPPRNPPPRHEGSGRPSRPMRPPPNRDGPDGRKPPRNGGRPNRKPGPRPR
jgi:hypothetical protein